MIEKKTYRTVSGKKVRVIENNRHHSRYPVIALVSEADKLESLKSFTADGRVSEDQHPDYDIAIPRFTRRNPNLSRYVDNIESNLKALKKEMAT